MVGQGQARNTGTDNENHSILRNIFKYKANIASFAMLWANILEADEKNSNFLFDKMKSATFAA